MDDIAEYNEHNGGNNAGGSRCEGAEEGEDGDWKSCPAGVDTQRSKKDGNKAGGCTSQKKCEHPVRCCSDKREGGDDVCRQGNFRRCSQH